MTSTEKNIDNEETTIKNLPQPTSLAEHYTYLQYDKITSTFFPNTFEEDTLCWIFKTKGRQHPKRKKKQKLDDCVSGTCLKDNVSNENHNKKKEKEDTDTGNANDIDGENKIKAIGNEEQSGVFATRKKELFSRARIVNYVSSSCNNGNKNQENKDKESTEEDKNIINHNNRYLVRYSKGATYHVRPDNLLPVLEPNNIKSINVPPLVIVTSDTSDYRRMSVIHTCVGDTFLEIGCDFGICVHRVQDALDNIPWVDRNNNNDHNSNSVSGNSNENIKVLGLDKSVESLKIANQRYPKSKFIQCDVLTTKGMSVAFETCESLFPTETPYPTVIALDINGNRELSTVLLCLKSIMNFIQHQNLKDDDNKRRSLPRLFIVKSVLLYQLMNKK